MSEFPQTKAEAEKLTYGTTAWNRSNFNPKQCAATAADTSNSRWTHYHQCTRKPGHGPDGLYCKMHSIQASNEEFDAYYVSFSEFSPEIRIRKAKKFTSARVYYGNTYSKISEVDGSQWFKDKESAVSYFKEKMLARANRKKLESEECMKLYEKPPIRTSNW